MRFFIDFLYLSGIVVALPWIVYRLVTTRGFAKEFLQRFGYGLGARPERSLWLHGSSVGEVSLLKPLIRQLEHRRPDLTLIVTSHTATGVTAARLAYPKHRVLRFPFDLSFVQRRMLRTLNPLAIVIVESDLWPNHLLMAERSNVAIALVNAKLSEKSFRRHRRFRIVPRALSKAAVIAAQTAEHAERFAGLGVPRERIRVTGNMKYDSTTDTSDADARAALRARLGFAEDDLVVIGGSLHPREDSDLLAGFAQMLRSGRHARLIVVPRYPEQSESVIENARALGFDALAKTELDRDPMRRLSESQILIVDTLGDLTRLYAASDIAFVGGSLYYRGANKGGHNLMEPAILGLPVLFGPYNFSFKETVADLTAADAGVLVHDRDELTRALIGLIDSPERRNELGRRARRVVIDGQGASARNVDLLLPILDRETS